MKRYLPVLLTPLALAAALPAVEVGRPVPAGRAAVAPDRKAERQRITGLIQQLGDPRYARREAATRELLGIGVPALEPLHRAAEAGPDLEVRRRAAQVLAKLWPVEEIRRIPWDNVHVYNTSFAPDRRHFLAGGDGGRLRLYEVESGKQVREFAGHTGYTQHAVFTPDGKQVLSASTDGTLRLWDVATGQELRRFEGHQGGVQGVAVTADGKRAVSGGDDRTLRLWDVASGKEVRKLEGHTGSCAGLFSPDGRHVLSYGGDGTLRLWEVEGGRQVWKGTGHTAGLWGAYFLPGGKRVLSYSADRTARVWDLAQGKEVRKLDLGNNLADIRGVALSPDGKRLLVGHSIPAVVRVVDLATGREVHRFSLATQPRGLSFSPDGRLGAGGSWRGLVYLWRLPL
jgi:WD40 repeat protein